MDSNSDPLTFDRRLANNIRCCRFSTGDELVMGQVTGTIAPGILIGLIGLGVVGGGLGAQKRKDAADIRPPGKLVDLGGYKLHVDCVGTIADGKPPVILIHGGGDFSFDWALVTPGVARFTHVCAYDQAGQAWSDPGPTPRTLRQEAYELHQLLEKISLKGPFVLVGHSIGGLIARVFA